MEYRKIQEALEALQKGRLVLVIDDKDRKRRRLNLFTQSSHNENVNFVLLMPKDYLYA